MSEARTVRVFKYGKDVAVRLPKVFGIGVGAELTIERRGHALILRRVEEIDPEHGNKQELANKLREIGTASTIEPCKPIETPDLPGLK